MGVNGNKASDHRQVFQEAQYEGQERGEIGSLKGRSHLRNIIFIGGGFESVSTLMRKNIRAKNRVGGGEVMEEVPERRASGICGPGGGTPGTVG